MHPRNLIAFLFLLTMAACRNAAKPKNLLPPEKMQAVLWDMMRADQFLSDYVISKDTSKHRETESRTLFPAILRLHGMDAETFRTSLAYYRSHPDLLKPIMDSLSQPVKIVAPEPPTAPVQPVPVENDSVAPATSPIRQQKDSLLRERRRIREQNL